MDENVEAYLLSPGDQSPNAFNNVDQAEQSEEASSSHHDYESVNSSGIQTYEILHLSNPKTIWPRAKKESLAALQKCSEIKRTCSPPENS